MVPRGVIGNGNMRIHENGIRSYLRSLERDGLFKWLQKEVDKDWEIGAVTRLLFSGVYGLSMMMFCICRSSIPSGLREAQPMCQARDSVLSVFVPRLKQRFSLGS